MRYDWMIVGTGIYGATCAQQLAQAGQSVLIIDRRSHLAGNCHTSNQDGIQVHEYGPHVFHTNSEKVWAYVNQFATFSPFVNRVKAVYRNRLFSLPINLHTLYELWGVRTPQEATERLKRERLNIQDPQNLEEWALATLGPELYLTLIYGYTKKQWGCEPRTLPASILKRIPIRLTYDDNYYSALYQGVPLYGYTAMVENMLYHPKITIKLNESFDKTSWKKGARHLIYTGPPDEFLDYRFGELEYRSLRFEHTTHNVSNLQGNAIINSCDLLTSHTRSIEHSHFLKLQRDKTIVTKEIPQQWYRGLEPFYPIATKRNLILHKKYRVLIESDDDVYLGGRLGNYRYYDMDQAIGAALGFCSRFVESSPRISI